MKLKFSFIAVAIAACVPTLASAQFSLPSLGSKANAGPDLGVQQTQIVTTYAAASKNVLTANSIMADALGLKDVAAQASATANGLTAGATTENLKDGDKASSATAKAVQDGMAKQSGKLDAESKKRFATAFVPLTAGMVQYVGLRKPVTDFATGLKGASLLQVPKLQTGAYIVQNFPTGVKNLSDTMQSAIAFAKSNDIPVPADATAAMDQLK